jgi:hypothetical protein
MRGLVRRGEQETEHARLVLEQIVVARLIRDLEDDRRLRAAHVTAEHRADVAGRELGGDLVRRSLGGDRELDAVRVCRRGGAALRRRTDGHHGHGLPVAIAEQTAGITCAERGARVVDDARARLIDVDDVDLRSLGSDDDVDTEGVRARLAHEIAGA